MIAGAAERSIPQPDDSHEPTDAPRSLEEPGDEIAELSAHIDAATWRLLRAIAEFDRRGGWGGAGFCPARTG